MSNNSKQNIHESVDSEPNRGLNQKEPTTKFIHTPVPTPLPPKLVAAIRDIYEPSGMKVMGALCETESSEYGASRLNLDGHSIVFRVAKTTPTKIGQFVTIWKRPTSCDAIAPLDMNDGVAFVIISVCDETDNGQFVFNQKILVAKGIMSQNGKGGKRGIRVYPPWTKPESKVAVRTQQWQLEYFFPISQNGTADSVRVLKLFEI